MQDSTIPGAGKGLFVHGSDVVPGTVLGFFGGLLHLREHLFSAEYQAKLFPDPDFMLIIRCAICYDAMQLHTFHFIQTYAC